MGESRDRRHQRLEWKGRAHTQCAHLPCLAAACRPHTTRSCNESAHSRPLLFTYSADSMTRNPIHLDLNLSLSHHLLLSPPTHHAAPSARRTTRPCARTRSVHTCVPQVAFQLHTTYAPTTLLPPRPCR